MLKATFLALSLAMALASQDSNSGLNWKMHPVQKVIKMLTDMQNQLEKEAEQDEEIMDKMVCWCETNDKAKTKAIADANSQITQLEQTIEEKTALKAQLKDDLEQLAKDLSENTAELAQATSIREKEHAEFVQAEKDQMTSITGLTKAVAALESKIGGDSLLQVKRDVKRATSKALDHLDAEQRATVTMFLQTDSGLKSQSKAPASAGVFGILKQMKESFESGLKDSQTDEADAQKAYDDMKAAKEGEIASANDMTDSKTKQSAEAVEVLAESKADLEDTKKQLEADTKFLADLKEKCGNMDEEFAARKKVRTEEIAAVGEALGILTSDEAHDQFNKSLGFVQIKSHEKRGRGASFQGVMLQSRTRAARLLLEAGVRLGSPRLSELSIMMRTDVFAKIKQAIDDMLVQLKQEQEDEMKHRDWCIDELNQNERQTDDGYDAKKQLEVSQEELEMQVKNLGAEIEASNKQIADTLLEMKRASENREAESKDFQVSVQDQKATQAILKKVLERLQAFYNKKAALLQSGRAGQAPPPGFGGGYKKSGASGGVMMMLEAIIKESKDTEADAVKAEQDATAAYEGFVKDSSASLDALRRGISEKKEAAGKADAAIAQTKQDLSDNLAQLEQLHAYNAELHESCDFTIKHYETRQTARAAEMEALNQGKAILSGADPALLR